MNRGRKVLAIAVALFLTPCGIAAVAATPALANEEPCLINSWTNVSYSVDYLRVHTAPGLYTPVSGQAPGGSQFTFCKGVAGVPANGHSWIYGHGITINGAILRGWVAEDCLNPLISISQENSRRRKA